jgi:hypothetical protein
VDFLRSRNQLCLSEELRFYSTGTRSRVKPGLGCEAPATSNSPTGIT